VIVHLLDGPFELFRYFSPAAPFDRSAPEELRAVRLVYKTGEEMDLLLYAQFQPLELILERQIQASLSRHRGRAAVQALASPPPIKVPHSLARMMFLLITVFR